MYCQMEHRIVYHNSNSCEAATNIRDIVDHVVHV